MGSPSHGPQQAKLLSPCLYVMTVNSRLHKPPRDFLISVDINIFHRFTQYVCWECCCCCRRRRRCCCCLRWTCLTLNSIWQHRMCVRLIAFSAKILCHSKFFFSRGVLVYLFIEGSLGGIFIREYLNAVSGQGGRRCTYCEPWEEEPACLP
jgi:hypothetical protein